MFGRWTEYCTKLYNYEVNIEVNILGTQPQNENADMPILLAEVEETTRILKTQTSSGVENVPAQLIQRCEETMMYTRSYAKIFGKP